MSTSDSSSTTLNCELLVYTIQQKAMVAYPFVLPNVSLFIEALGQYCPRRDDGKGSFGEEILDMGQYSGSPSVCSQAYLYNLVHFLVVLVVRLGDLVGATHHLAAIVGSAVARRGEVRIGRGAFGCGIPLVVRACGVGLEVVRRRSGPRRMAWMLIHGEGGLRRRRVEMDRVQVGRLTS